MLQPAGEAQLAIEAEAQALPDCDQEQEEVWLETSSSTPHISSLPCLTRQCVVWTNLGLVRGLGVPIQHHPHSGHTDPLPPS